MKDFRFDSGATMVVGVALCVIGLYVWIINYHPQFDLLKYLNLEKNWPFFLVALGFYLIVVQYNDWWNNDGK